MAKIMKSVRVTPEFWAKVETLALELDVSATDALLLAAERGMSQGDASPGPKLATGAPAPRVPVTAHRVVERLDAAPKPIGRDALTGEPIYQRGPYQKAGKK